MGVEARRIRRVLVVEDDADLRAAIVKVAQRWSADVVAAGSVGEARARLTPIPDLIVLDLCLPDGPGADVLQAASTLWPHPLVVAVSGTASSEEAFELAQRGARAYLAKPLALDDLVRTVERVRREPPALDPMISACVGRLPMREVQDRVRGVMVREALELSGGSRQGAGRLLSVTRQAIQQILRRRAGAVGFSEGEPAAGDAPGA